MFIHGSASGNDAAGSVVITALTYWLAWAAVLPCGQVGRTTDPLFHILSPSTHLQQQGRWELYAAPSWHLMLCVASSPPCTLVSLFAGPQCLFLNYCIWNQLPNHGAKNTANNQVIRMWVDELFLYTVRIANKSLNLFRELDNIPKAGILSIVPSSLLVFFKKRNTHMWSNSGHVNTCVYEHTYTRNLLTMTSCLE